MTATSLKYSEKWRALRDAALIVGVLLISKSLLLDIDAIWSFAGPISLLLTLGVAFWCVRNRQKKWTIQGDSEPQTVKRLMVWTLIALVVTMLAGIIAQTLVATFIGAPGASIQAIDARYQGRFDNVEGNLPVYLFWLALAWIIGGFTEEILFRGILFTRLEALFAGLPAAAMAAILFQAVLFGQQHYYYQGLAGWIATGAIGVASGVLYLKFNRNLWPLIFSHGISNTIGLTLLYLGIAP